MDLDQKVVISDQLFTQKIDDEMVILDMQSEYYFGLNSVAADIWSEIQECDSLQTAVDNLVESYDVEKSIMVSDMEMFLNELINRRLVEVKPL